MPFPTRARREERLILCQDEEQLSIKTDHRLPDPDVSQGFHKRRLHQYGFAP